MAQQLPLPGLPALPAKPGRVRKLSDLYWEATCSYWGPIAERLASENELGPEGLQETHVAGEEEFMSLEEFKQKLDKEGVPYRE